MSTLADVAKKTGLSAMTVSRCFNDAEKVKKDTRELVMQAAKELNYMPNSIARSLVRRETKIIFVYIPAGLEISHPFVMQAIAAIGEVLGQSGYSFLLSRKFYKNENCDGIIAANSNVYPYKAVKDAAGDYLISDSVRNYGKATITLTAEKALRLYFSYYGSTTSDEDCPFVVKNGTKTLLEAYGETTWKTFATDLAAGDKLTLTVYRISTGKTLNITITLTDSHDLEGDDPNARTQQSQSSQNDNSQQNDGYGSYGFSSPFGSFGW